MAEQKLALGRIFMVLVILIAVIGGLAYKYIIPQLQESNKRKNTIKLVAAVVSIQMSPLPEIRGLVIVSFAPIDSVRFFPNFRLVTAMNERRI